MTDSVDCKKEQILDAALKLLLENGLCATSMNDIVRASGLSKGGVYHYYSSKEDVLLGVLEHLMQLYNQDMLINENEPDTACERLVMLLTAHQSMLKKMSKYTFLFVDFISQAPHFPKLRQHFKAQYQTYLQHIASLIVEGIEAGEFKSNTSANTIAAGLVGIFDGVSCAYNICPDEIDFPTHAIESAMALLNSIKT